jgi:hypothetical protein
MHVPTSFHRHTQILAKSTKSTIRVRLQSTMLLKMFLSFLYFLKYKNTIKYNFDPDSVTSHEVDQLEQLSRLMR